MIPAVKPIVENKVVTETVGKETSSSLFDQYTNDGWTVKQLKQSPICVAGSSTIIHCVQVTVLLERITYGD